MRIILASSSPYRRSMLERLQLPFSTVSPNIDETAWPDESAHQTALRLSMQKAQAVALRHPDDLIIGSDQVASCNGIHIGKPGTIDKAREQLRFLSGKTVTFHSGLCVHTARQTLVDDITTLCRFRHLSDKEIDAYLARDTPFDTAGSAKAEGLGILLMESMESDDPTAIIGLPLIALGKMLRSTGINPLIQATP